MGKAIKKIARVALPVAAPFVLGPAGLGLSGTALTAGSALAGAAGGALGGGGLKGAALGGLSGALGGGLGGKIASNVGLTGAGAKGLSGALQGAAAGLAGGGGLQSALIGAGLGGAGGYALGGGFPETLGRPAQTLPGNVYGPPAPATGVVGKAGGLFGGGTGDTGSFGLGKLMSLGGNALSAIQQQSAIEDIEKQLMEAQGRSEQAIAPYSGAGSQAVGQLSDRLTSGFNPGDLTQDPGYQFRLQQGQEALNRQLAASGLSQSGAAMKAAQEYGQGLADQTYNDAYNRWLQQNSDLAGLSGLGAQAGGTLGNIYTTGAGINTAAQIAMQNQLNEAIANTLYGRGRIF